MMNDSRVSDTRHLNRLRRLTNLPLGESGVYARLEWLAIRPSLPDCDDETRFQLLIESLVDMYAVIHSTFDEFRPAFDPMDSQRPRHPKEIRRAARMHFAELLTTTRFEVEDLAQVGEIIALKFNPCKPLEQRHSIALAALVCLKTALETLEEITDSQAAEIGRLLTDAAESSDLAAMWLAHRVTEDMTIQQIKIKRSKQSTQAAKNLRTPLTPELVASHFKANPGKAQKTLQIELAELHDVSKRTVSTRIKEARTLKLMQ